VEGLLQVLRKRGFTSARQTCRLRRKHVTGYRGS
jgi:hypothetical protein